MTDKHNKGHVDHGSEERDTGSHSPDLDSKEGLRTVDAGLSANQVIVEVDDKEGRRILRKIDYRLIPLLAILYLYMFPDFL